MSEVTRSMKGMDEAALEEPSKSSPISELPPEVLEKVLKNLDCGKNSILPYRLVHPSWKAIIDDHLEKKSLRTEEVVCPKVFIVNRREATVRCPEAILHHKGNPFPWKSLLVTENQNQGGNQWPIRSSEMNLIVFTEKFGNYLTTLILDKVSFLSAETLLKILSYLSNLKVLMLKQLTLTFNPKRIFRFDSIPALPNLIKLELNTMFGGSDQVNLYCNFIGSYSDHLVSLGIHLHSKELQLLQRSRLSTKNDDAFRNLRQLKLYDSSAHFLRSSCSPPLRSLSIVGLASSDEVNVDVLMQFVDKFSNTLQTLDLDVEWRQLFDRRGVGVVWIPPDAQFTPTLGFYTEQLYGPSRKDKEATTAGGKLSTAGVVFPKLTRFTIPFPSNELESAVIRKTFLVKFPALKELKLLHYKRAYLDEHQSLNDFPQTHGLKIREFLAREDYWKRCGNLNHISVWFSGESGNHRSHNYLLHSSCKEVTVT